MSRVGVLGRITDGRKEGRNGYGVWLQGVGRLRQLIIPVYGTRICTVHCNMDIVCAWMGDGSSNIIGLIIMWIFGLRK